MSENESRRAVIYARCAASPAGRSPIDEQLVRCRAFAAMEGLKLVGTYRDINCSGRRMADRPTLSALLASAHMGAFEVLLTEDFSRLSRNAIDLANDLRDLSEDNVAVQVIDGPPQPFLQPQPTGRQFRPKAA